MTQVSLKDARHLLDDRRGWTGLGGDALAWVLADLARDGRWLVVVDEADAADRLVRALRFFHPRPVVVEPFPADDVRPYDGFSPHPEIVRQRIRTLQRVEAGGPVIVVAAARALAQRVPDQATRRRGTKLLQPGTVLDRDELARFLTESGYLAVGRVEDPACFAVRGDVLDVWPSGLENPVRIDFFDDEIEEIRRFDPASQRTTRKLERALLLPAREERVDREALERFQAETARRVSSLGRGVQQRRRVVEELRSGIRFSAVEDWLSALVPTVAPLDAMAGLEKVVLQPDDVRASLRSFEEQATTRYLALAEDERPLVSPDERYLPAEQVLAGLREARPVHDLAPGEDAVDFGARAVDGFGVRGADLAPVAKRLEELVESGTRVGLVVEDGRRAEALVELLENHDLRPVPVGSPDALPPRDVGLLIGDLPRGFVAPSAGVAFVPAGSLFGRSSTATARERIHVAFDHAVQSMTELKEGDHVVHRMHGIGIYRGLQRLPVHGGGEQDFVRLEYRGGDLMYLPVTRLDEVGRYTASRTGVDLKLDRLGGQTWAKRRQRVRDSILKMAQDLLGIYARRELATRPPLPPPGPLYRTLEGRFPYAETPDQAAAIDAIHEDLSSDHPMDRLLCGDVGFGKTEVAMRAAARVVESGRQVGLLCPTTVLAFQHLRTLQQRFEGLPVRIGMLSRLTERSEEREVIEGLKSGRVDIVVGTTKLLGRGVRFRDLGLLVVDEEHRFGVKQKERIKKMRAAVDILSMSATPIPRTLEMALSGMRTMSVMTTPPAARLSVRTQVARFQESRIRDAILRELDRQGQVFFVHNRVQELESLTDKLREWVPEARFAIAHGQMEAEPLEEVLVSFIQKKHDVLVSSAIVESGVDLPNVNTMIVNRADRFGLAQLYQLRGRVGRGSTRGDCLLLVPDEVRPEARRRLQVVVDNTQLGAGLRIATADLEMRGAGNLLGDAQSGNIDAVGYDVWVELLEDAIDEARGAIERARIDPEVEVPVPAFLPEDLIPEMQERLSWYRRFSTAGSVLAVDGLLDELEEWYGELPDVARNLGGLTQARIYCRDLGFVRCSWLKVRVVMELHPRASVPLQALRDLARKSPKRFALTEKEGEPAQFEARFLPQEAEYPFRFLRWVFTQMRREAGLV